jgi:hypothetical protein
MVSFHFDSPGMITSCARREGVPLRFPNRSSFTSPATAVSQRARRRKRTFLPFSRASRSCLAPRGWLSAEMGHGLHQGFAQSGQQAGEGNRPAVFGPRITVHSDEELARGGKRGSDKLDFEVFVMVKILDRNSQICFHKAMIAGRVIKTNCARSRARPAV